MASITLKSLPDELHRSIKRMQLNLEEEGKEMSLEDIYIMLIKSGLDQETKNNTENLETKKPSK